MPTYSGYYYGFWEVNPKLWAKYQKNATAQMLSEGWKTYANRFDKVLHKRVLKLLSAIK